MAGHVMKPEMDMMVGRVHVDFFERNPITKMMEMKTRSFDTARQAWDWIDAMREAGATILFSERSVT